MSTLAADWISPSVAIVIAIIAGAFSFLGLVLSKEQKVSELRQAWIDGLREDLAAHIAAVFAVKYLDEVYEYDEHDKPKLLDFSKAISEPHMRAAATFHRILLRLNPDDENVAQKQLIAELKKMRDHFVAAKYEDACKCAPAIQEKGRLVLKAEWKRVKQGELTFRLSKYIALVLLVAAIAVAAVFAFQIRRSATTASATPSPQYDIRPQQSPSP